MVLIHAITRDGLIAPIDEDGRYLPETSNTSRNAELLFPANASGDNHGNMCGEKFIDWITERLFPAFQEKYPGKKMILVLDNASYHHVHGVDYLEPHKMRKEEVAAALIAKKIEEVTVVRDGQTIKFAASTFSSKKSANSPAWMS